MFYFLLCILHFLAGAYITASFNDYIKADAKQNNKYFSGWYIGDTCITTKQSYTFYVKSNMTVTVMYDGDAVQEEKADIAVLITRDYLKDGKQKVVFSINWALPSGCKLKEAGIVRRYDSAENLTLANVDGNEIKKNASVLRTQNGTCTFNLFQQEVPHL